MSTKARNWNTSLNLTGKTAVIAGGSQGIGAGVAVRFAKAGANVLILGRNESLLAKTVADMKAAAPGERQRLHSIQADFSTITGIKAAAKEIEIMSNGAVDYLVQSQGGTPNGRYDTTSEGVEMHFAVQVLSRFVLQWLLATNGTLKGASLNIMSPGYASPDFTLDDIEVASVKGKSAIAMMGAMMKRDSQVIDAYTKSLQVQFPACTFYHLYPGLVATNVAQNQNLPWWAKGALNAIMPVAAKTFGNSTETYAEIPVFLAANEGPEKQDLVKREGLFLGDGLKAVKVSEWAEDTKNQEATVERLKSYFDA